VRHVCLVGCGKSKLDESALAQDLYTGALFRKSRAYAEQFCDDWGILSAKHGLVLPGERIGPYNVAMCDLSPERRARWCDDTYWQILRQWGRERQFTVLAGEPYLCATAGLAAVYPMRGMGIGERLRWLTRALGKL